MWNITFLITGAMFIALLIIFFFSKEVINSRENKLFKSLMLFNALGYLFEISLQIVVRAIGIESMLIDILAKVFIIIIFTWFSIFSLYTFTICLNKKNKDKYEKRIKYSKIINSFIWIVGIFYILYLPFEKFYDSDKMYVYGQAVDFLKTAIGLYMAAWMVLLVINLKNIKNKKYVPIFLVLFLLSINVVIQSIDPSILISTMAGTIACYTMYFTIENPDMKLLNEYARNSELVENAVEEKSHLIFALSEDVKTPIRQIKNLSEEIYKTDNKDYKEYAKDITVVALNALNRIDKVLNISLMDVNKNKSDSSIYGVYELYNQIIYIVKDKLEGVDTFKYNISKDMPTRLRGDSTKIKEIITSIIFYTYEREKKGTIDLDVSSIIKNKVCRSIITINHKGSHMSLQEINNRLDVYVTGESADGNSTQNFKTIRQIIESVGGTVLISSDERFGITYTIVIDQLIEEEAETKRIKELIKNASNKRKAIIADDKIKELDLITKYFRNDNLEVIRTMFGKDVVDRINDGEKFDIMVLDNSMNDYNAVKIVNELGKEKLKGSKVIVLLDQNEERIKDRFKEDYPFDDYILKSNIKEELNRITEKY